MASIVYKKKTYGGSTSIADANHVIADNGSGTNEFLQNLLIKILGNFATIQSSTTASKAYNVGEYLILNSYLYRVKTAIAAGGTIDNTSSGNVVKTTVEEEMKANAVLDFVDVAITAGTGDLATITDSRITAAHKVAGYNIAWGNRSYITSDVTVTTSAGQAVINGTCTGQTTATFQLVKPN